MKKGFTLIELLVVMGILAILLTMTLIAINPVKQFGQTNNTKRRGDILQILNAIHQYAAENKGELPAEIADLTVGTVKAFSKTNFPLLCGLLLPSYIAELPTDPSLNSGNIVDCSKAWDTGYAISKDAANRLTVSAPTTYNNVIITVTR